MQSLLTRFRVATRASHEALDSSFGSLDLSTREDYVRFLRAHAIGMAPLFSGFRRFVAQDLGVQAPDYPSMLAQDLERLGERACDLPQLPAPKAGAERASAYVIAGSRLGLAVIRKGGYWGSANGLPGSYMDDDRGQALWKDVAAALKAREVEDADAADDVAAAVAAFDTFRAAFAASGLTTAAR